MAWRAVAARSRCPRLLGVAQNASRRWDARRAVRLLRSCQDTPFESPAQLVRHVLQYLLTPDQLARVGHATRTPLALRLALQAQRRAARRALLQGAAGAV